jgi:hypothetical protein
MLQRRAACTAAGFCDTIALHTDNIPPLPTS